MTLEPATMVILASGDNVGIALCDISAGALARTIDGHSVQALEPIPQGHKIALAEIAPGASILRLGMAVGIAKAAIAKGRLAHVHNIGSRYLNNDEDHYE
jgi:altronate dehydratase small subunit